MKHDFPPFDPAVSDGCSGGVRDIVHKRRMTEDEREEALRLYLKGDGVNKIARKLGFWPNAIKGMLVRRGHYQCHEPKAWDERFNDLIHPEPNTGCFLWSGAQSGGGYGYFCKNGRNIFAHRLAYEMENGNIPDGYQIDHLCRNRICVNPDHLEAVTSRENMKRAKPFRKEITHCKRGHPLSGDNLYINPASNARVCKECRRGHDRARR